MKEVLQTLLNSSQFIPHGHCYLWQSQLVTLHLISDVLIGIAYYSIPITLLYFVHKRQDIPFNGIFLLFGAFIVACGTTHLMEVWTLWHPVYWLSGGLKLITAVVSLYTALKLVSLLPKALALPGLAATNQKLEAVIAAQQKTEFALRESEERFRNTFEQAAVGIAHVALNGQFFRLNQRFCDIAGYPPGELQALTFQEITYADDLELDLMRVNDLLNGKIQTYSLEKRYIRKDRSLVWINLTVSLVHDPSGEPKYFIAVIEDISDRKQTEAALSQLAAIVESSADAIISKTLDGTILSWNAGAEHLFGYTAAEAIGQSIFLLIPSERRSEASYILERIRQGELVEQYETVRQHKDGRLIDISLTVSPIRDGTGKIVGASKISRDISFRKQVEAERLQAERLRLEFQLLETILEVTFAGYWDWDIPGNQQYLSPTLKRMFGYADHELPNVPETWQRLIFAEDLPGVMACFNQHVASRGQIPYYNEVRYHHKDGSTVWVICSGRVIEWDQAGHPLRMIGCHIDITERKRAETQLQASEAELRGLFAAMTDAVIVRDREGRCLKIAPNSSSLYRESAEMLGKTLHETIPKPEADLLLAKIHECLDQQTTTSAEYALTIQGNPVYFLANISPLFENTVIIVAHNISDLKQIETNLKRYERIVSSTKDGIALLDRNYTYQIANPAYLTWCNKSRTEVMGHSVREILGSDLFDRFIQPRLDQCLAGETIQYEKWFDYPNLVPQFLSVTYVPYVDVNQTIAGVIVSLRDITDLRQTEESLQISEERLQLALEGSGDGLWDWNMGTGEVYLSPLWQTMLGYAEGELPSNATTWEQLIHPDDKPWVMNQLNAHLKDSSTSYSFDYRVLTKSGEWKWIANYGKVVARDEQGAPLRMVGTHKDVSDRKQAEEQLRLSSERLSFANTELARAARLKDEFLAGMSHELRTPLNAVLGVSEALLEEIYGQLNTQQRDSLQLIERSGQHLLSLINDILDLSKIESGKMELVLSTVSVKPLCESSLNFVKQQATRKQIKLSCQIAAELTNIEADERRLRQVLVNLLNNAVKFTPDRGCVELRVSADPLREIVEFSVTDTGIGIAPEQMDRLFQPFVQLDSNLSRRYEGTGLGLALVRRIMDLHKGSVALDSEVGKGSCFTITLPWVASTHSTNHDLYCDLPELLQPRIERALIVEDVQTAANQLSRYLTNLGAVATIHPQGAGALEAALQTRPTVIILDILLPDQTGWEVLTELKATPATQDIPVIVISVVDERSRALKLGAAEYLLKPITQQQLQATLNRVLPTAQPAAQTTLELTSSNSLPPPLILLAEDNEANITTTTFYLEAHGVQTVVARNGLEAIQQAQEHQPALILMDIQMPEVDGLEAIRRIRSDTKLSQIPIIALTARAMPGDRERCLSAGANEYMTKPASLKQLFTLISTYIPTLQTRNG